MADDDAAADEADEADEAATPRRPELLHGAPVTRSRGQIVLHPDRERVPRRS